MTWSSRPTWRDLLKQSPAQRINKHLNHEEDYLGYSPEGDSFIPGRPIPWAGAIYRGFYGGIDLHPDGERLLVRPRAEGEVAPIYDHVVLFENFIDYLREQVPVN
jgi:hypothetical protein